MRLKMALDMLHRHIEEWTEEAMIEPEVADPDAEGFREFGSELVAYLHEAAEKLEIDRHNVVVPEKDADSAELCDEITELFIDEWTMIDFAERPAGVQIEGLREVMEAVADVLVADPADCQWELEGATEQLDEFLVEVI